MGRSRRAGAETTAGGEPRRRVGPTSRDTNVGSRREERAEAREEPRAVERREAETRVERETRGERERDAWRERERAHTRECNVAGCASYIEALE